MVWSVEFHPEFEYETEKYSKAVKIELAAYTNHISKLVVSFEMLVGIFVHLMPFCILQKRRECCIKMLSYIFICMRHIPPLCFKKDNF